MKTRIQNMLLALASTAGVYHAAAQGTAFTYQGSLTDNAAPANGSYDLTFALFNASSGGAQVGTTITNTATGVTNGLFTVALDFGGGIFTGANYWLQIGVRTNGGGSFAALSPLQELTPAPYAIYAPNAGSAGSVLASNIVGNLLAAQLPASALTNGETGVNLAGAFSGNGAGLTNLNGAGLLPGSVGTAQLAAGALAPPVSAAAATNNAVPNTSYLATNAGPTTFYLPTNANVGDVVQITGQGTGTWTASQNSVAAWAPSSAPSDDWQAVASSSDGTHLVAVTTDGAVGGPIYISTNSGGSWTISLAPNEFWWCVASSSDGTHLVAGVYYGGGIYTSTNSGVNWTNSSAPSEDWQAVASSSNGTHLVAVTTSGNIYTSTDSGAHWTISLSLGQQCSAVASSSDGTHLVVATTYGNIVTSTNSGALWTGSLALGQQCSAVASSSDGTHLVVSLDPGGIYISTNSGVNWTNSTAPTEDWGGVASSSDGTHLVAVVEGGGIYTSTNSGVNWTNAAAPNDYWYCVASSSDGTHLVAAVNVGEIYTNGAYAPVTTGSQGTSATLEYLGNGQWQTVTPAELITINAGPGLSGGGSVPLGGTTTLTNTGVLAVAVGGGLTASTTNGVVTLGTDATTQPAANTLVQRDASANIAAMNVILQGSLLLPSAGSGYSIIYTGASTLELADDLQDFFAGVSAGKTGITGNGNNTGVGDQALGSDTSGAFNTALGTQALYSDTIGQQNTAVGFHALFATTNGSYNTSVGLQSMSANLGGANNVAVGYAAATGGTNASFNTALGAQALQSITSGSFNIAVGNVAGQNITTGSNNIEIGHVGVSTDNNLIRLGNGQAETFIAGIDGTIVIGGSAVYVNSSGQLGVLTSSARFKENIRSMDDASDVLLALHPVTFRYKPGLDPKGTPQFGLVAEEVEKVDPDLVLRDATNGIYSVRYEAVNAMLLNEFLKEHRRLQEQNAKVDALEKRLGDLEQAVQALAIKSAEPNRQD